MIQTIQSTAADYNLTSLATVLSITADGTNNRRCRLLFQIGDGTKNKTATRGPWEIEVTIGSHVLNGENLIKVLGAGVRPMFYLDDFELPSGQTASVKLLSPDSSDTDVNVSVIAYDTTNVDVRTVSGSAVTKTDLQTAAVIGADAIVNESFDDGAISGSKIASDALIGKGDWNVGKTGYYLHSTEKAPTTTEITSALFTFTIIGGPAYLSDQFGNVVQELYSNTETAIPATLANLVTSTEATANKDEILTQGNSAWTTGAGGGGASQSGAVMTASITRPVLTMRLEK